MRREPLRVPRRSAISEAALSTLRRISLARSRKVLPSSVSDNARVVRRISFVPSKRSKSVRRSLTTDLEIARRRAAPVMEPDSAMDVKAAMDSNLSIVRFFRNSNHRIIGYRDDRLEGNIVGITAKNLAEPGGYHVQIFCGSGLRRSRYTGVCGNRGFSSHFPFPDAENQWHD